MVFFFFFLLHRDNLYLLNQFFHLSVIDAPTAASANNGSMSTSQNNNDLDIFGPMVSNPLPASTSTAQFSQVKPSKKLCRRETRSVRYKIKIKMKPITANSVDHKVNTETQ